jgi:tetratricopeptide (TPR) repeat protein
MLYRNLTRSTAADASKIAILPSKAFNSQWPVLETFEDFDRVLHLMGETSFFRSRVAEYLSDAICSSSALVESATDTKDSISVNSVDAADQSGTISFDGGVEETVEFRHRSGYGVNRTILISLARDSMMKEWSRLRDICRDRQVSAAHRDFEAWYRVANYWCEGGKAYLFDGDLRIECSGKFEELFSANHWAYKSTGHHFHLDQIVSILHKLLAFESDEDKKLTIAKYLIQLLDEDITATGTASDTYLAHQRALVYAALADHFQSVDETSTSGNILGQAGRQRLVNEHRMQALDTLGRTLKSIDAAKGGSFSVLAREYIEQAAKHSQYLKGLRKDTSLSVDGDALQWGLIALQNADMLFANFNIEERIIAQDTARLSLDVAEILVDLGRKEEALEYVQRAQNVYSYYSVPASLAHRRRSKDISNAIRA